MRAREGPLFGCLAEEGTFPVRKPPRRWRVPGRFGGRFGGPRLGRNLYWVKGRSITTPPLLYNVPCTIFASSSIYTQPNTQRRERVTRVLGLVLHLLAAQVLGGSMRVCRCGNGVTSWFDYVRLIQLLFRSSDGDGYCTNVVIEGTEVPSFVTRRMKTLAIPETWIFFSRQPLTQYNLNGK